MGHDSNNPTTISEENVSKAKNDVTAKTTLSVETEKTTSPTSSEGSINSGLASFLKGSILPSEKLTEEKKEKMRIIRPIITQTPLSDIKKFCISMSGCGFLGSYHFGAITCLVKNGEPVMSRLERVSGASAGSLVASVLLLAPEKIDICVDILYSLADELGKLRFGALTPGYFLNEKLVKIVDAQLPNNVETAKNKLYVSVTDYKTRQNVLLTEFEDKKALIQALMASCFIPMYSMGYKGIPPKINGRYFIDGGYSNNLPDFEDLRTITISPFSGIADISPTDDLLFEWTMSFGSQHMNVNMENLMRGAQALFPPRREILKEYFNRGFKDTYRFLLKNNLISRQTGTAV